MASTGRVPVHPVHWIATQTAKAVQEPLRSKHRDAMDKGEWLVTDIVKTGVFPDDLENLTPADWSHLSKAWADLPIFRLPMGREEFEPYRKAFESYLQPPPFDLDFAYGNGKLELGFQLEDAIDAHVEELRRWIDEGRVQQRTNISTLPTAGAWNSNICLDFESLCKFARSLSVGVFVITPLDPMTKGQRLLGQFREAGGRLKDDGTPGVRGALEALGNR